MKKTKKMLSEELISIMDNSEQYIQVLQDLSQLDKNKEIVLGYATIEKGKSVVHYECRACGNVEVRNDRYASRFYICPSCGNKHIVSSSYTLFDNNKMYLKETPDGFIAITYNTFVHMPYADDWYLQPATTSCSFTGFYLYDRSVGEILAGEKNSQSYIMTGKKAATRISELIFNCKDIVGANIDTWDELKNEIRTLIQEKERAKQMKAKKRVVINPYPEYRGLPINAEALYNSYNTCVVSVYDRNASGTVNRVWCSHCGRHYDISNEHFADVCPHCGTAFTTGRRYSYYRDSMCDYRVVFENTTLPDNDLLVRIFKVCYSVGSSIDSNELEFQRSIVEEQRVFLGKKLQVYGYDGVDCSEKVTVKYICKYFEDKKAVKLDTYCIQPAEEIANIIRTSCMNRSGLAESWGLIDGYKNISNVGSFNYIQAWYKYPQIELLVKANIPIITNEYVRSIRSSNYFGMPTGNTVHELLGINKTALKAAREHGMTLSDTKAFSRLLQVEQATSYEKFRQIQNNFNISRFLSVSTKFKLGFDSIIRYTDSVYDRQCIVRDEALNVWWDYLNMAEELSMDLSQKSLLYPASLKKEHDVAVFAYNAIKRAINAQKFAENAEINKQKYEFSNGHFFVKIPECPEDIIEEASRQHNCLRSYIERVRDGSTTVAFIRRTKYPDDSYVSVEIFEDRLAQVKAAYNQDPCDKDLDEFLLRWCNTCNIAPLHR